MEVFMKTIITIQHTQSVHHTNGMVGSWTDWELSELGVSQAKNIGEKLKAELAGREFVIYSSDLLRAKQTAEIVGSYLGLTPLLRSELRERNLGKCCGKSQPGTARKSLLRHQGGLEGLHQRLLREARLGL